MGFVGFFFFFFKQKEAYEVLRGCGGGEMCKKDRIKKEEKKNKNWVSIFFIFFA